LHGSNTPAADPADVEHLVARCARSRENIEAALDLLDHFAESGNLAALTSFLRDFDENFNAITRPDPMGMFANLMMVLGMLGRIRYEPFFALAMKAPAAINAAYPKFETRDKALTLKEALSLVRSPEVAGLLEMLIDLLRGLRPGGPKP
jgi:uncharacterized protein YjgD (DUF1641 family)